MQNFDVVIVGAGLSGLRAAQVLEQGGLSSVVIDRNEEVGGRLASHTIDDYVIDAGFQLVNPSYPELKATKALDSLDLRPFSASLSISRGDQHLRFSDPRQAFFGALSPLLRGGISVSDASALVKVALQCGVGPIRKILDKDDERTWEGLAHAGLSAEVVHQLIQPFLRGTLLDDTLESSWHLTQLLLRSFLRGRPGTFAGGVVELPRAMARQLDSTQVKLNETVVSVTSRRVETKQDQYSARAVLLATDATDATKLGSTNEVTWRSQTTWWISGPKLLGQPILHIDLDEPLLTSVLDVTSVVPERAPRTTSLFAAPAIGVQHDTSLDSRVLRSVAKMYDLAITDVSVIERTVVERALPSTLPPLALNRPQRVGDIFLAGDYLQTPSIQGALVSGRRAAQLILKTVA